MRPNVLLIVLDTVRYDHCSCNGYERNTTPFLTEFCTDAVRFENAFSAAPWTPPSHGSLFTGHYPSHHGYFDEGTEFNAGCRTITEVLHDKGYGTIGVVPNVKIGSHTPIAKGFDQHLEHYQLLSYPDSISEVYTDYIRYTREWIRLAQRHLTGNAQMAKFSTDVLKNRMQKHQRSRKPFFGFVNYLRAHGPYEPYEPYRSRFQQFDESEFDIEKLEHLSLNGGYQYLAGELDVSEAEWNAIADWYDGEIAYLDSLLNDLINSMKEYGIYEDTMIIITADHGEHFGENGRASHQFSLYDELIHIPLLIKFPNQQYGGEVISELVSHIDIAPTITDACGIKGETDYGGMSLLPLEDHNRDAIFAEYGRPATALQVLKNHTENPVSQSVLDRLDHGLQCIRTNTDKYIRVLGGDDEFYDIADDPDEQHDLLTANTMSEKMERAEEDYQEKINTRLKTHPKIEVPEFNESKIKQNLQDLGYL